MSFAARSFAFFERRQLAARADLVADRAGACLDPGRLTVDRHLNRAVAQSQFVALRFERARAFSFAEDLALDQRLLRRVEQADPDFRRRGQLQGNGRGLGRWRLRRRLLARLPSFALTRRLLAGRALVATVAAGEADADQHRDEQGEDGGDRQPALESRAWPAGAGRHRLDPLRHSLAAARLGRATVVVGKAVAVEAEGGGIGADDAERVGAAGQRVPLLVLERLQVADADLGRRLDRGKLDFATISRLAQGGSDAVVHQDIVSIAPARRASDLSNRAGRTRRRPAPRRRLSRARAIDRPR